MKALFLRTSGHVKLPGTQRKSPAQQRHSIQRQKNSPCESTQVGDFMDTILNPNVASEHTYALWCRAELLFIRTWNETQPVYIYTDISESNLVGDWYMRLLIPIQFPPRKVYHL
jgi:hypothetical protein